MSRKRIPSLSERPCRLLRDERGPYWEFDAEYDRSFQIDEADREASADVARDYPDAADWSIEPVTAIGVEPCVAFARTCILFGAEGENPEDCTTHDHEC